MEIKSRATLDDVFNMFVATNEKPTAENLQEWVDRYPQYRRELVEFAAAWAKQLVLPAAPEMGSEAEKALIERSMSYVLNVAYDRDQDEEVQRHVESDDVVHSLTRQAQYAGMSAQELANACRLDLALISKLNRRLIKPKTIPAMLISLLGRLLRKPVASIAEYFAQPPQASPGVAFLARGKPTSSTQQSFADAVRASSLSKEEKTRWLKETPDARG